MAEQARDNNRYDTYRISGVTYIKDTHLGPKAWKSINEKLPGRFIDILEAKLTEKNFVPKIDINK
ncbi:MAG: hypothetical protein WC624_01335 [Candidatus Margulisiibacteriota bacterium]